MDSMQFPVAMHIVPEHLEEPDGGGRGSVEARIRYRAYARYEIRGFENGFDLEDWLAAEREILEKERQG